jgi:hypothetical protein
MTPKSVRISVYQQILHEFRTSIRRAQSEGTTRQEIEGHILTLIRDCSKSLSKLIAALLVIAISIENLRNGTMLPIKTALVEIEIPAIYCAFLGSLAWLGILVSVISLIQLLSAKTICPYVFHKWRRFSEAEWAITGSNYFDTVSPLRNGHFFKIWLPFKLSLLLVYFFMMIVLSTPVLIASYSILSVALAELESQTSVYLGKSISIATAVLMVLPPIYLIAYFIPFPVQKDKNVIRWNFLVSLVWGARNVHPQYKNWLKK